MIRTHLVKSLYDNLLGPQNGPQETVEQPYVKYQIGILESCYHEKGFDPPETGRITDEKNNPGPLKLSPDILSSDDNDVQWPDTEIDLGGSFTLGISFVLKGSSPKIHICSTWGRYVHDGKTPKNLGIFKRKPNYFLTGWLDVSTYQKESDSKVKLDNFESVITKPGVELWIRSRFDSKNEKWTVQVFLVNRTPYMDKTKDGKPQRQTEEERIFQPQIRINSKDSNVDYLGTEDEESLQYLKNRTKARGFQCGAMWDEIDPESKKETEFRKFTWHDAVSGVIPAQTVEEFTCPHVRTEYIPAYSIMQPEPSSREYDADFFSNSWEFDKITDGSKDDSCIGLNSLVKSYDEWISKQKSILDSQDFLKLLPSSTEKKLSLLKQGKDAINECQKSLEQIQKGIDFLRDDERARLAFCFMNSVMSDNRKHANKKKPLELQKLKWREFQMAFILQSLRGVVGHDKEEQNLADVLWFPTGGGKTEAYLGIIIFASAYRRLLDPDGVSEKFGTRLSNDGGVCAISRYTLRLLTIQQFQRALGVFVVSDLKRVKNWVPNDMILKSMKFVDDLLNKKFLSKEMWGNARFSIGLWIGGDATPTRFAYMPGGNKGKVILNAEGLLLSSYEFKKRIPNNWYEPPTGDPAQVSACPVCGNVLCISDDDRIKQKQFTWIIKTSKNLDSLNSIPKSNFESQTVKLAREPLFTPISENDGEHFVRVTMDISLQNISGDAKKRIDEWWHTHINPNFVSGDAISLCSTRASMPGYFFLKRDGDQRPYDFVIHCTDKDCDLNTNDWHEKVPKDSIVSIPKPFRKHDDKNSSISVPISAYTVDEQIYAKCPTFIIATSDKFANLPWDPRCSSLFGNVDCFHDYFGFGRRSTYSDPRSCNVPLLDKKNQRLIPQTSELSDFVGFLPPSLIVQDELHLIEGPLGSMVGVYEMAVDVLCRNGNYKPKYIASSATIKEAPSQVGTIFRKDVRIFPRPGIFSDDNFFAIINEDPSCSKPGSGRLYLGICSGKSTYELPIKATAILMSEIYKIKENPETYGISESEMEKEIDPYWTHVSYFSDLQLMSRFESFYRDDIERDVKKFSPRRIGVANVVGTGKYPRANLVPITADVDLSAWGISVYCQNTKGSIAVALYDDNTQTGNLIWQSSKRKCSTGENPFFSDEPIAYIKKDTTVWIAIICDSDETLFHQSDSIGSWYDLENIKSKSSSDDLPWYQLLSTEKKEVNFPALLGSVKPHDGNPIRVEITGKRRDLNNKDPITLSSETKSEDLPKHLETLQLKFKKEDESKTADALLTSPVFGTGIDVDRLGLMSIMNQPKTTSGYIQATGRVGRSESGLVVDWLRARRARDLDHYENFVGYHRKIHSYVEPVTANPFSHEALQLCLGPILVAILRNAKNVNGTSISPQWAVDPTGPLKIIENKNGSSAEISSIKNILSEIGKSHFIPPFRLNNSFNQEISTQLKNWLELAEEMSKSKSRFIYGERNPSRPASSDVVLGSPFHEKRGFAAAFSNTRNSMRDTENTAIFFNQTNQVAIRPSQFLTRYGPGSLLPSKGCSVTAPSVSGMISDLDLPIGNFHEPVENKHGLKKIEIEDLRMAKRLYQINGEEIDFDNIHIFSMPTNESLNSINKHVKNNENIYEAEIFPKWGICSKHIGDRVLGKIVYDPRNKAASVRCPYCQQQSESRNEYSTSFTNVRFVLACKNGHLSDVDWTEEIHRDTRCNERLDDDYRVYLWNETGGGDNIVFRCLGVWKGDNHDQFVETKCDAEKRLTDLKHASIEGMIPCKGKFIEESFRNGEACAAPSKFVLKSMMSLRSPINISTLVIHQRKSHLFEKLFKNYAEQFCDTKLDLDDDKPDWVPDDLADKFVKKQQRGTTDMGNELIREMRKESRDTLETVFSDLKKHLDQVHSGLAALSESENLESELRSLENGVKEGSLQQRSVTSGSKTVSHPIRWVSKMSGLYFEAMPFNDIKVTNVQTGYTREVDNVEDSEDAAEKFVQTRTGKIVSDFSRYLDKQHENVWYMGNQNIGEGIFIHLQQKDESGKLISVDSMFDKDNRDYKSWNDFHVKVSDFVERKLKDPKLTEHERDHFEGMSMKTHPLFVWWHSFAHQIIAELAIDSGFTTTSLNERVYLVDDKTNGILSAGILVYVSTPGSDGTLGGLTSLVDDNILPKIITNAERHLLSCSNDPVCSEREFNEKRHRGSACHSCLMSPETTCSYQNKFLDRNLIRRTIDG